MSWACIPSLERDRKEGRQAGRQADRQAGRQTGDLTHEGAPTLLVVDGLEAVEEGLVPDGDSWAPATLVVAHVLGAQRSEAGSGAAWLWP